MATPSPNNTAAVITPDLSKAQFMANQYIEISLNLVSILPSSYILFHSIPVPRHVCRHRLGNSAKPYSGTYQNVPILLSA